MSAGQEYHDGDSGGRRAAKIDATYARLCRRITDEWTPALVKELSRAHVLAVQIIAARTIGRGRRSAAISPRAIARDIEMSSSWLYKMLDDLEALGVIVRSKPRRGRTPRMAIVMTWAPERMSTVEDTPGEEVSSTHDNRLSLPQDTSEDESVQPTGHLDPEMSTVEDTPLVSKTPSLESATYELGNDDDNKPLLRKPTTPIHVRNGSHEISLPNSDTQRLPGDVRGAVRDGDYEETPNHHHDEQGLGSETRARPRDGRAPDDDGEHSNPHKFRKNRKAEKRYGVRQSWTGLLAEMQPESREIGLDPNHEDYREARAWWRTLDVAAAGYEGADLASAEEVLAIVAARARRGGGEQRLARVSAAVGRCAKVREAGSFTDFVALVRTYLENALTEPLEFTAPESGRQRSRRHPPNEASQRAAQVEREIEEEAARRRVSTKQVLSERYNIGWA